jgi:hypothetical protein
LKLNLKIALASSVSLAALYTVLNWWGAYLVAITDLVFVLVSGLSAFFGLLVVLKLGVRGRFGWVQLGLFLAVFSWFLGDLVWGIYEVGLGVPVPYPSLADIFYLAGYFPAIIGVALFLKVFSRGLSELKLAVASLVGLMIIGLTYSFLLNPLLSNPTGLLTKAFDVAYPTLDAILLTLTVVMLLAFEGAPAATPWFWISVGIVLTTIYDISFSFGTLQGWYYSGHPIELLYAWGYVSMGLGFDNQRKQFG